jgi:hypothetical protein
MSRASTGTVSWATSHSHSATPGAGLNASIRVELLGRSLSLGTAQKRKQAVPARHGNGCQSLQPEKWWTLSHNCFVVILSQYCVWSVPMSLILLAPLSRLLPIPLLLVTPPTPRHKMGKHLDAQAGLAPMSPLRVVAG